MSNYFSDKDTECISICWHAINEKAKVWVCTVLVLKSGYLQFSEFLIIGIYRVPKPMHTHI